MRRVIAMALAAGLAACSAREYPVVRGEVYWNMLAERTDTFVECSTGETYVLRVLVSDLYALVGERVLALRREGHDKMIAEFTAKILETSTSSRALGDPHARTISVRAVHSIEPGEC